LKDPSTISGPVPKRQTEHVGSVSTAL